MPDFVNQSYSHSIPVPKSVYALSAAQLGDVETPRGNRCVLPGYLLPELEVWRACVLIHPEDAIAAISHVPLVQILE